MARVMLLIPDLNVAVYCIADGGAAGNTAATFAELEFPLPHVCSHLTFCMKILTSLKLPSVA